MPKRSLAAILMAAFVLILGVVAAGCGEDDEDSAAGGGGSGSSQEEKPAIKVGLVTDIGGLNDRSFNQLANEGLERAKSELGVEGQAVHAPAQQPWHQDEVAGAGDREELGQALDDAQHGGLVGAHGWLHRGRL